MTQIYEDKKPKLNRKDLVTAGILSVVTIGGFLWAQNELAGRYDSVLTTPELEKKLGFKISRDVEERDVKELSIEFKKTGDYTIAFFAIQRATDLNGSFLIRGEKLHEVSYEVSGATTYSFTSLEFGTRKRDNTIMVISFKDNDGIVHAEPFIF